MEEIKTYNIEFKLKHDNLTRDELWALVENLRDIIEDKYGDIDMISVGECEDE